MDTGNTKLSVQYVVGSMLCCTETCFLRIAKHLGSPYMVDR